MSQVSQLLKAVRSGLLLAGLLSCGCGRHVVDAPGSDAVGDVGGDVGSDAVGDAGFDCPGSSPRTGLGHLSPAEIAHVRAATIDAALWPAMRALDHG